MSHFSSIDRTIGGFGFEVARAGHYLNKFCLQAQHRQAEEQLRRAKEEDAIAEAEIEQLRKALQPPPQPEAQQQHIPAEAASTPAASSSSPAKD